MVKNTPPQMKVLNTKDTLAHLQAHLRRASPGNRQPDETLRMLFFHLFENKLNKET